MPDAVIHQLVIRQRGDRAVAELAGEVDQSNARGIQDELQELTDAKLLVLDLSATTYLDSAGVAMLHVLRQQTELALVVRPESIVRRVLDITGFDQLARIVPSADDVPPTNPRT